MYYINNGTISYIVSAEEAKDACEWVKLSSRFLPAVPEKKE